MDRWMSTDENVWEKEEKEQTKGTACLSLSAVANEISSVDQSEIMIQGMAS